MDFLPLKNWFLAEKRDLPWRRDPVTPYRVWISEVMLQQTQASVVVDYFERWMQKFPTVEALAEASLEEVVKAWEGLGYYARARCVHAASKKIVAEFGGSIPSHPESLRSLKGLGPYTVGAIRSFAFKERAAAVDGNVVRVLARLLSLEKRSDQRPFFQQVMQELLPEEEAWIYMEAFIELGAQICTKNPQCGICPLQNQCLGYKEGKALLLPLKKPSPPTTYLQRRVAIIVHEKRVLLKRVEVGKVMGGLYEFPYVEEGEEWNFPFSLQWSRDLTQVKHSFTRYLVTLYPAVYKIEKKEEVQGFEWRPFSELQDLPFSSGHRRILKGLMT